jgi:hypothetical protein
MSSRTFVFATLMIFSAGLSAFAQRRFDQRLPPPRDLQFYEPRNKLEELDGRVQMVLVKGRTYVGTVRVVPGSLRIEATEIHDITGANRATGVVITFLPDNTTALPGDIRSSIDYEEIDPLVKALDAMIKADDSVTKLTHFEVRYRTPGDFEAMIVKQITGNVTVTIEGGFFERTRFFLTPDELTKLRWFIAQAKDKLDEMK